MGWFFRHGATRAQAIGNIIAGWEKAGHKQSTLAHLCEGDTLYTLVEHVCARGPCAGRGSWCAVWELGEAADSWGSRRLHDATPSPEITRQLHTLAARRCV